MQYRVFFRFYYYASYTKFLEENFPASLIHNDFVFLKVYFKMIFFFRFS